MNTTLAVIFTIVVTNWVHIGDFKDTNGKTFDVQEGRLQTNIIARVVWEENPIPYTLEWNNPKTNEFILKSVPGPIVGEKRVEITNIWVTNIWHTNLHWFYDGKKLEPHQIPYPPIYRFTNQNVLQTNLFLWQGGKKTHAIPAIKLD